MAAQFVFRPLNFEWKDDLINKASRTENQQSSVLPHSSYVENLMLKLPAFPRTNTPTLVIETGYTTTEKKQNLLDEAFLGQMEDRTLVVNSPNYISGGAMMSPTTYASNGVSAGAGASRSTTPVKKGPSSDMNLQNRLVVPYGSGQKHQHQQHQLSAEDQQQYNSPSSSYDPFSNNNGVSLIDRRTDAVLIGLEHRRRMRGDETYFGMIAFSNLSRPPIDLVAPFRMGSTNPNEHFFGSLPPEQFRLTLAQIKNDEDLLRLYEEISSSTSFREAASRLSIVCFITANPPQSARHSWNQSCACALQDLVGTGSGTDIVVLLQEEHHLNAMPCLGVDTNSRSRQSEKSAVPAVVTREFEQWTFEREKAREYQQQQHHSSSTTPRNPKFIGTPPPSPTTASVSSMKLPCAGEVLRSISLAVGLRGDAIVLSRLTTESLASDQLELWRLITDVEGEMARRHSPLRKSHDPLKAIRKTRLEGHSNNNTNSDENEYENDENTVMMSPEKDDTKNSSNRFLAPGSNPTDWIIPMQKTSQNEVLEQLRQDYEERIKEDENRKKMQQQALSRGASVTAYLQASNGVRGMAAQRSSAISSEVQALEEQVNLQKQALRWFQHNSKNNSNNGQNAAVSPTRQMNLQQHLRNNNNNNNNGDPTMSMRSVSAMSNNPSNNNNNSNMMMNQQQHQQQPTGNPFLSVVQQNPFFTNSSVSRNASPEPQMQQQQQNRQNFQQPQQHQQHQSPAASASYHQNDNTNNNQQQIDSPLQSSPQAVRTKLTRAHTQTEQMSDDKTKWLLELDRAEVAHSGAVAKRFQAARKHAELQSRVEELSREITEIQASVLNERQHVEEKSRAVIALRKQLDVSDGATKRAESQLGEIERQQHIKHKQEHEELEQKATQRKREIDGWYERATQFQRESEVQRATTVARQTSSIAEEKRRKEHLAQDRSLIMQEMSQSEASQRLTEVAIQELRRKVATTQTELQRARSLQHELSIAHQDIDLESAVLQRLRIDVQHIQDQILDMEKAIETAEEQNRVNIHTSEEVTRFGDVASAQSYYSQSSHLRADEHSSRLLIYRDFVQSHAVMVKNFIKQAMSIEDQQLTAQLKNCKDCKEMTSKVQELKVEATSNATRRKQVAQESIGKERQLELQLQKYEKEMDQNQDQRDDLVKKLEVHHARHAGEREKTSQRLMQLISTRDALLQEFFRQIDGETRRCVSQLTAIADKEKQQEKARMAMRAASGAGRSASSSKKEADDDDENEEPPTVTVNLVNESSSAFTAAEYSRWCDEIADAAAAEQRVHDLQDRLSSADSAGIVSSDNVAESRSLLLHLEHENETRESALRTLEKEVDSRRHWLKNRRGELEEDLEKQYQDAEKRNKDVESQIRASTEAVARLKQTIRDERFRANALASEIETVETGSAVALLLQELNNIRESNRARREILQATNRATVRSKSDQKRTAQEVAANMTSIRSPADLSQGTRYPPAAPSDREQQYGDLPRDNIQVPFFAGSDARSPQARTVPTQGDFKSALNQARGLVNTRASLFPGNSPAVNNNSNNNNNNNEMSPRSPSL